MAKKDPQYFQFEPGAFLSDVEFQQFSAAERGVFCTVIFYLYKNNGRMKNDPKAISRLCNSTTGTWSRVKKKFISTNGFVKHKRVSKEIKKAKRFIQAKSEAGVKGAKARWQSHGSANGDANGDANGNAITKKSKGKVIEEKKKITSEFVGAQTSSSPNSSRFLTGHFELYDRICQIIKPKNQSDRTSFSDIAKWVTSQIEQGTFNADMPGKVIGFAREAAVANGKSAAIFTAILQKNIGWHKSKKL